MIQSLQVGASWIQMPSGTAQHGAEGCELASKPLTLFLRRGTEAALETQAEGSGLER